MHDGVLLCVGRSVCMQVANNRAYSDRLLDLWTARTQTGHTKWQTYDGVVPEDLPRIVEWNGTLAFAPHNHEICTTLFGSIRTYGKFFACQWHCPSTKEHAEDFSRNPDLWIIMNDLTLLCISEYRVGGLFLSGHYSWNFHRIGALMLCNNCELGEWYVCVKRIQRSANQEFLCLPIHEYSQNR